MNKQYKHTKYYNNHCTESSVLFYPHVTQSQCVHDTVDLCQSEYDTLEDWIDERIDAVLMDYEWGTY